MVSHGTEDYYRWCRCVVTIDEVVALLPGMELFCSRSLALTALQSSGIRWVLAISSPSDTTAKVSILYLIGAMGHTSSESTSASPTGLDNASLCQSISFWCKRSIESLIRPRVMITERRQTAYSNNFRGSARFEDR